MRLFSYDIDGYDALAIDLGDRLLPLEWALEDIVGSVDLMAELGSRLAVMDGARGIQREGLRSAAALPRPPSAA